MKILILFLSIKRIGVTTLITEIGNPKDFLSGDKVVFMAWSCSEVHQYLNKY